MNWMEKINMFSSFSGDSFVYFCLLKTNAVKKNLCFIIFLSVIYQIAAQCNFSLGNDTIVCQNSYTINGPPGYTSYNWSTGAATQNITVTTSGNYSLTATNLSGDLVINGNFSAGNTGFFTAYNPPLGGSWGPLSWEGTYMISTNPQLTHTNFLSYGDHTTGTGNMMVVNGAGVSNTIVWEQTISVIPATNYNFSAWVSSTLHLSATQVAQLQFSINGNLIGTVYNAPTTGGIWQNFFVTWNSGPNNAATIRIINQNTATSGNDFALDDIFFQEICMFSDTISVTLGANIQAEILPANAEICQGDSTQLSVQSNNTLQSYTWSTGQTTQDITVSPAQSTTYSVTVSDVDGCSGTASATVTVNPNPVVTANAFPPDICAGSSTDIIAEGGVSYFWDNNLGQGQIHTVFPSATTTYQVTGTDASGCTASAQVVVQVTPEIIFDISPSAPVICEGDSIDLTVLLSGMYDYIWSDSSTTQSLSVAPLQTTTYSVTLTDSMGCSGSAEIIVQVNPVPFADFSGSPSEGCVPASVHFTNLGSTGDLFWQFGDGATSTQINPSHQYNSNGIFTVTLIVSEAGCADTLTLTDYIQIYPQPVSAFSPSETDVYEDESTVFFTDLSTGSEFWLWDFGTATADGTSQLQNPEFTFPGVGSYTVWQYVKNQWGCSDSTFAVISVKPMITFYVPNAFTPNGDGVNEYFQAFGNNIDPDSFQMLIFDRWGRIIFRTNNINIPWDGSSSLSSNGIAPQGMYIYQIDLTFDNYRRQFNGTFSLIY